MASDFKTQYAQNIARFEAGYVAFIPQSKIAAIQRICDAMGYSALNAGKRLRPFLLMETARMFGADEKATMAAAAAIECVHVYSLVHDDLPAMDNDDERRGKPTLHKKYDEATAILAGDALLTLAFEILGEYAPQLVKSLAQASGWNGMVGGQMMDLEAEKRTLSLDEIITLQSKKTGALFNFCTEAGAILGKASDAEKQALKDYTASLGLLFQITDDILDVEGDPAKLGKAARKDEGAGKATIVSLMGLEKAKTYAFNEAAKAKAALTALKRDTAQLAALADYVLTREK